MPYWIIAFVTLAFQALNAISPSDKASIETTIQDHEFFWNETVGRGFSKTYAANASFVNIFGMHFSGNEEIEKRHVQILETFLKDSKFKTQSVSLREVNPDLVIAHVHWLVTGFHNPKDDLSKPGETKEGIFTHVFVKNDDKWKIESTQNTLLHVVSGKK